MSKHCDHVSNVLFDIIEQQKNNPFIYSRSHNESNRYLDNYPDMKPNCFYHRLCQSDFVTSIYPITINARGITSEKVDSEFINKGVDLEWDKPPKRDYDHDYVTCLANMDLEFKNVNLLSKIKSIKYPNEPISKKLIEL